MKFVQLILRKKIKKNCCHQMSDFKAKMHQIRSRLGLSSGPRSGSLQRSPDPLAGFDGPTSKGGEGRKRGWEGRGGRRREGRKRRPFCQFLVMWPRTLSALNPSLLFATLIRLRCCLLATNKRSVHVSSCFLVFRSTSKSRPNNVRGGKNVRPYVSPQKVSSI